MEIRNDPNAGAADRRQLQELRSESVRASRHALEGAQESVRLAAEAHARTVQADAGRIRRQHQGTVDRLDLSPSAQALAGPDGGADPERAARVQELKAQHEQGALTTPERIDRAATRMLGGH